MKNAAAVALGSIKTEKKAAAARENGKRGGRPLGLAGLLALADRLEREADAMTPSERNLAAHMWIMARVDTLRRMARDWAR